MGKGSVIPAQAGIQSSPALRNMRSFSDALDSRLLGNDGYLMIRWMIVIFLALVLISWFTPLLNKLGFGKLPGDFRFKLFGREWFVPLTTTLILSLLASLVSQLI